MSCSAPAALYDDGPDASRVSAGADADADDLARFFDVSLDLLVIRDLEGRIVRVSRSWQTALGHSPEEMRGKILLNLVHPDDLAATLDSVVEVENRRPGDPVLGQINRYRHK